LITDVSIRGRGEIVHRAGSTWTDAGFLGPIGTITEWVKTRLAMKQTGTARQAQGPDIEIDNGRILVPPISPLWSGDVYRKIGGV
jgi:hypothetical protein